MASLTESHQLHIFFFPFMAQGHLIPMIDMARLFATHGVKVGIITTPLIASRFQSILDRDQNSGNLPINLHVLNFPSAAAGLPENCESVDTLPSRHMLANFSKAIMMLQPQSDQLVHQHKPDAIISDMNLPWTSQVALKYNIPRLVFHVTCCFSLSIVGTISRHMPHLNVTSSTEPFLVPGLPDPIHVTKSQMPEQFFSNMGLEEFFKQFKEAEKYTYGVVTNTFYELEPEYVEYYKKMIGKNVWPIGPFSLYNTNVLDMAERGNKASIDKDECLEWLNSKKPNSVLYVCFGSLCDFSEPQLVEIGLGLEASKISFIWVIRENQGGEFMADNFEERVKGRGLIIRGWAPQVLLLNNSAVGGFMTHCGWNSVSESVSAGVPMICWPLSSEQFYNEKFVLTRLRMGVGIGVESGLDWGTEDRTGNLVKRERVEEAVTQLMGEGESVESMRKRASELGEMASLAVSKGGSSDVNMGLLIQDLLNQRKERLATEEGLTQD